MKERKNISLLVGIVCEAAIIIWSLVKVVIQLSREGSSLVWLADLVPVVILMLALVFPGLLLARNLKNKAGETLPIISLAANGIVFLLVMASLFTVAAPEYLVLNELGLVNIYVSVITDFLLNGGLLFMIGSIFLILGSLFSLPPKSKKVEK